MKPFLFLFSFLFWMQSCDEPDKMLVPKTRTSEGIYADYQVWAEEDRDEVTVRLQFRKGHEEGDVLPTADSRVLLDGEEVPADSTRFAGVYYEATKPINAFAGTHTVVLVDKGGREYHEEFLFQPFTLAKELPDIIKMKPFTIHLENFPQSATRVRLVIVDTSLLTADVNEEMTVEDARIDITEAFLANLSKGPATLEIYREEERQVRGGGNHRGRFAMTYGLRRHINFIN
jgi:hypothetical protein